MTVEISIDRLRVGLRAVIAVAMAGIIALWRAVRPLIVWSVQLLFALLVIFEEWGWEPLATALAALGRFRPVAALERRIAMLPPYGALCVFAAPVVLIFPLKLAAVWLLANGHALSAGALFIGAKVASTAIIARIFMLTRPALMRIDWFARAYHRFMPWKEAATAWLRQSWAWRMGRVGKVAVKRATLPLRLRAAGYARLAIAAVRHSWPRLAVSARAAGKRLQRGASAVVASVFERITGVRVL